MCHLNLFRAPGKSSEVIDIHVRIPRPLKMSICLVDANYRLDRKIETGYREDKRCPSVTKEPDPEFGSMMNNNEV